MLVVLIVCYKIWISYSVSEFPNPCVALYKVLNRQVGSVHSNLQNMIFLTVFYSSDPHFSCQREHINKSAVLIVPSTICITYNVLVSPNPLFATWRTQNELRVVMVHYKTCFCFSVSCCKQHIKQVWSVHFTLQDTLEFQSLLTHVPHATKNTLNKLGLFTLPFKTCFCLRVLCCKGHIKWVGDAHFTLWDVFLFQSLLTHVSRATKNTLNKLGVFTVSSFHAFICARSPSLLNNLLAGRGATKRRPPMLSRSNSGSSRRSLQMTSREESEKTVKVSLPDNQVLEQSVMCLSLEFSSMIYRNDHWMWLILMNNYN